MTMMTIVLAMRGITKLFNTEGDTGEELNELMKLSGGKFRGRQECVISIVTYLKSQRRR